MSVTLQKLIEQALTEIDLKKGDFLQQSAMKLFLNLADSERKLHISPIFSTRAIAKVYKFILESNKNKEDDVLLPVELQSLLLKAGSLVYKKGSIYIIKVKRGGAYGGSVNAYLGFDFSKPAADGLFIIGYIFTKTYNKSIPYSPSKQLDLKNVEQVTYSEVALEHRGIGYGKVLYDAILKETDALFSDTTLYQGSLKMWMYHISRKAKFFGVLTEDQIILPIYNEGGLDEMTAESVRGFVGIKSEVPPKLKELKTFLKDRNPNQVLLVQVVSNSRTKPRLQSIVDDIESATSVEDLIEDPLRRNYMYDPLEAPGGEGDVEDFDTACIILEDKATLFIRESGSGLKYMLL